MFNCAVCGKVFMIKRSMLRHIKLHNICEKFNCELCIKSYLRKHDLKRHISDVHRNVHPLQNQEEVQARPTINKTFDLWDDLDDECVNALNNYEGKIFYNYVIKLKYILYDFKIIFPKKFFNFFI